MEAKAQTSEEALEAKAQTSEEALEAKVHTSISPGGFAYHYRPEGVPSRLRLGASEDCQFIEQETVGHNERVTVGGISDSGVWAFVLTFRSDTWGWIRLEHLYGSPLPPRPPPRARA